MPSARWRDDPPVATIDDQDITAITRGLWDANRKLDAIIDYLLGEDDEEEEAEGQP